MNDDQLVKQFQLMEDEFNQALASNNIELISKFLSADWVLVEPQFGIVTKVRFLHIIGSGALSHISMKKRVLRVQLRSDIAVVISRGKNIGFYKDSLFDSEHWVTNIYKNENNNWICIMTQEAPVVCGS